MQWVTPPQAQSAEFVGWFLRCVWFKRKGASGPGGFRMGEHRGGGCKGFRGGRKYRILEESELGEVQLQKRLWNLIAGVRGEGGEDGEEVKLG